MLPENLSENAKPSLHNFYLSLSSNLALIPESLPHSKEKQNQSLIISSKLSNFITFFQIPELTKLANQISFFEQLNEKDIDAQQFPKTLNIDRMIGFYLYSIGSEVSPRFFREYVLFCAMLLNFFYTQEAQQKKTQSPKIPVERKDFEVETKADSDYKGQLKEDSLTSKQSEYFDMSNVVDKLNEFISVYFVTWYEKCVTKSNFLRYVGLTAEQLKYTIIMGKLVADWIFDAGLVDFRMEINWRIINVSVLIVGGISYVERD